MKIKADDGDPSGKALAYSQAVFVIWRSQDGRTGWEKVKPEDVPEWVTHPAVLGRLVNGDMCMDPMLGERGSDWYRADVFLAPRERERLESALAQHDSSAARKILKMHTLH